MPNQRIHGLEVIKVDKEERPDIDHIYQSAHYIFNRKPGGWPLSVFMTPEQEPYFIGTYIPKNPKYNLPGMNQILPKLSQFFKNEKDSLKEQTKQYYEQFFKSLSELDTKGVEIIPQTMAPFPWHFGGQRYQNIFVEIEEIEYYCNKFNIRMCFDISHSMLTCNYLKSDFYEFCERIAPYTAYLHLGDAKGLNGEGLQIGEGEIDFEKFGNIINSKCKNIGFIPEIWQGHKDMGKGFWIALQRLNGII